MFPFDSHAEQSMMTRRTIELRREAAREHLIREAGLLDRDPGQRPSRGAFPRQMLLLGVAVILIILLALRPWAGFMSAGASAPPPSPPAPQVRAFALTASEFAWEIMPGVEVQAWGYNQTMPGPELRVREGDTVRVTLRNELPVGTTIHWHGVDVPPATDGPVGLNQAAVAPGETFTYEFTATNPGTRWYHAHADPKLQIAMGLYGSLVVEPREPARTYDRDYTYVLAEWDLELTPAVAAGQAPPGPRDQMLRGGELGTDLFLLNGHAHESIPPVELAEGERVRLRLINAGNLPHAIHSHGHSFRVVATDGNEVPLGMELTKDTVLIGPGERYDLELLGTNPGVWMLHCHMENHADNGMMTLIQYEGAVPTGPVAEFFNPARGEGSEAMPASGMGHASHVSAPVPSSDVPAAPAGDVTKTAASPAAANAEATASGMTGSAAGAGGAGGPVVEVALVDDRFEAPELTVAAGTTVRFVNRGGNWHSVAAFDGSFASGRLEPGQVFEVVLAAPGEVRILCQHHALRGMVGRLVVEGPTP